MDASRVVSEKGNTEGGCLGTSKSDVEEDTADFAGQKMIS